MNPTNAIDGITIVLVSRRIVRTEGQGRVNAEIIRGAVERGFRFTLLAEAVSPELLELPGVEWVQVHSAFAPTDFLKTLVFAVKTTRWLRRNRDRCDIVHVDGFVTFGASDVNVVHYVHTEWLRAGVVQRDALKSVRGFYQFVLTFVNASLEQAAFRRTRAAIAVSERVREELIRLGVPGDTVDVVPNGVDVPVPAPVATSREELGIPGGVFLLLFAGDLQTARKNVDVIFEALVHVPEVHLAVAGDVRSNRYPLLRDRLGLTERVHFISFRKDDLPEVMAAADVFVIMSLYEPFGLVILEAMASGTAVITSKTLGASGLVGDAGIVLPDPKDALALAEAIRELEADREATARMGKNGREIALRCTWSAMASAYIDIYQRLAHTGN